MSEHSRSLNPRAPRGRLRLVGLCVLVAVLLPAAMSASPFQVAPAVVPRVTVVNPHDWWANVEVTDVEGHGWVTLIGVDRQDRRDILEVVDQGHTWVFRFSYAQTGVVLTVSRAELKAHDWVVTIPDGFAERLQQAGTQESSTIRR